MSNADKVAEYFRRQYDTEEGTVEENLAAIFTDDLVYELGGQKVGREGLVATAQRIRNSPRDGRVVIPSAFREEGDDVTFHLSMKVKGLAVDGSDLALESDNTWRFNADGKVYEAFPAQIDEVADAFRAMGVEPEA